MVDRIAGLFVFLVGVAAFFYLGVYLLLVDGVVTILEAQANSAIDAMQVFWGIVAIFFAFPVMYGCYAIALVGFFQARHG